MAIPILSVGIESGPKNVDCFSAGRYDSRAVKFNNAMDKIFIYARLR